MKIIKEDLFAIDGIIEKSKLCPSSFRLLHRVVTRLNWKKWQPVSISISKASEGMSKPTFLKARKELKRDGWLNVETGTYDVMAVYSLGPRFDEIEKTEDMRERDDIKTLVMETDREYPDFSAFCAAWSWPAAIKKFKVVHPELLGRVWPIDSIGDPDNQQTAHEMFVKLNGGKVELGLSGKLAPAVSVWAPFEIFIDMWLLDYPKKSSRKLVTAEIKAFTRANAGWTAEQVSELQQKITTHTAAYIRQTDAQYVCAPHNYIAARKWTEKLFTKAGDYKQAGAHAVMNLPKSTKVVYNK